MTFAARAYALQAALLAHGATLAPWQPRARTMAAHAARVGIMAEQAAPFHGCGAMVDPMRAPTPRRSGVRLAVETDNDSAASDEAAAVGEMR